jgi:hypothetical protein
VARYELNLDVANLTAIDTHVHVEVDDHGHNALTDDLVEAASKYFKTDGPRPTLDDIAAMYRERKMAAVVFTVDATTSLTHRHAWGLGSMSLEFGSTTYDWDLVPST